MTQCVGCADYRMPRPAGTGLSRRSFLLKSAGLGMAVYGGRALAPRAFEEGVAAAQAQMAGGRTLVSVFFSGGLDSLSMLAPTGTAYATRYATMRPTLAILRNEAHAFGEDPSLQWHTAALPLRTLHAEGKLTVIPGIGYTDPNQSHFTSRHFWEVGALDPGGRYGWLGRYLDRHGSADNPLQGLALDWSLSPVIATSDVPVAAVGDPTNYELWIRNVWDSQLTSKTVPLLKQLGSLPTGDPALSGARSVMGITGRLAEALAPLQPLNDPFQGAVTYPSTRFADRLAILAEMLDRDMPIKVAALTASGGYDTHDNQAGTFANDLGSACQALLAFQRDLEARGIADRVLTLGWSEFGRRPEQNATGTDHGAGGAAFVMGARARGTMVGEFPGLATLDAHRNLRHSVDFRSVYVALLDQWLQASDAEAIVPSAAGMTIPQLVRAA